MRWRTAREEMGARLDATGVKAALAAGGPRLIEEEGRWGIASERGAPDARNAGGAQHGRRRPA
jgi:hypothetical protein